MTVEEKRRQNRESYHRNKKQRRINQKRYETKIRELIRTDKILHSKALLKLARTRAKKLELPFDITYKDIPIPEFCPVLNIKLVRNKKKMQSNSATVDRIIPHLGYVKGNVIVISLKANVIKNNGTPNEILRVGKFFEELENVYQNDNGTINSS